MTFLSKFGCSLEAVQAPTDIKTTEPLPILECPPELGPTARQEWERIVAELIAKGVLSRFDRGPLAAYCTAHALAMESSRNGPQTRRHDQIAERISDAKPVFVSSQSAIRDDDAHRNLVWLYPG